MSGKSRGKDQAPSTIEAIRMASASVLATTTKKGFPLGSAVGSGSMMEENSEVVAMNVAPLIFGIRDTILTQEGLDLLSVEWDLDRVPGPRVLPEQLIVSGSSAEGVGSYVCVISWEKGVVDPFKIDTHMKWLSKKIANIESAIENNEMSYEEEGLEVLRKFNDRFNKVVFVEMMDRRFQGSWDSLVLKPDHVDMESVVTLSVRDDFTIRPPGIKILERKSIDFKLPDGDDQSILEHFKYRVLTPAGIEAITEFIPEAGRAILSELNAFAYSIEESSAVRVIIEQMIKFIGGERLPVSDIESTLKKTEEFSNMVGEAITVFEEIVEQHITSGKSVPISSHKEELEQMVQARSGDLGGFKQELVIGWLRQMMELISKEIPVEGEIRAWQLKSTMRYFIAYTKRAAQYFERELGQYLIVASARKVHINALEEFKQEMVTEETDPTDKMLFEKFYNELYAQLIAIFDKRAFEGTIHQTANDLVCEIADEMTGVFSAIKIWNLVEFSDIANIARLEINKESSDESSSGLLLEMLSSFETLVTELIPDLAQTLLAKDIVSGAIEGVQNSSGLLTDEILRLISNIPDQPERWMSEANTWIEEFKSTIEPESPLKKLLLTYIKFVHDKQTTALGARAVINKVVAETYEREHIYDQQVSEWEVTCKQIEQENEEIHAYNERREKEIERVTTEFEVESASYEKAKLEETVGITAPELLDVRVKRVEDQYPLKSTKPIPPKPTPTKEHLNYRRLKSILTDKIEKMADRQKEMASKFSEKLASIKTTGLELSSSLDLGMSDDFLEYLMDSSIRGLGHIFPRTTRAYLRDPENPSILILVTYEHKGSELIVSIGNNYLRGEH